MREMQTHNRLPYNLMVGASPKTCQKVYNCSATGNLIHILGQCSNRCAFDYEGGTVTILVAASLQNCLFRKNPSLTHQIASLKTPESNTFYNTDVFI